MLDHKTPLHLSIQHTLAKRLAPDEVILEKRMGDHIADLVWIKEKIVFEIQCSPISLEEAALRTHHYENLGFRVIWILHTKQFYKNRMQGAERYLRYKGSYYTDLTALGYGSIFDQKEYLDKDQRVFLEKPTPIDIREVTTLPSLFLGVKQRSLREKFLSWYDAFIVSCLRKLTQR